MSERFEGVIGRTVAESVPWWPPQSAPAAGSPNVVVIVLDDTGFAHLGCYGSCIETPSIDRLAMGGLRYVNFHTTALCSPTRAALLTGRNHHSVGMRAISNFDTGFPNMRGAIPRSAGTIAEILREQGYGTFAVGKWHLAPMAECSAAGPFTSWPLQKGFDRFYGFLQGETDQFHPELVADNHYITQPRTAEDGYHLSEDLVDHAIAMVRDQTSLAPERPFFLYLGFGATHSPHQAPADYLEKYRGRFDSGWDVARDEWFAQQIATGVVPSDTTLPERNPGVKPWQELASNEQRFASRLQEAFAAFLDHTDAQIGRLTAFLDDLGLLENTLLVLMSDNGASQEGGATGTLDEMRYFNGWPEDVDAAMAHLDLIGGPNSHSNYPWGWAMAGNTPLKRYKQNTHAGGVRDPLIVHWPSHITDRGGIRNQFHHVSDLAPTILDAIGLPPSPSEVDGIARDPMTGTSLAYTFRTDAAHVATRKQTQYFEMFGHRGIYHDGWKAVAWHRPGTSFDEDRWELYHADHDMSECHDLAAAEPQRLELLQQLWWVEAGRNDVLPLDDRGAGALFGARRPGGVGNRTRFTYHPPISYIPADACPPMARRMTSIACRIERRDTSQGGALVARGNQNSGYVLYVADNRLVFTYNCFRAISRVESSVDLPSGSATVGVSYRPEGAGAHVSLLLDNESVGSMMIPRIAPMLSSTGLELGRSPSPIDPACSTPLAFEGLLGEVVFDIATRRPSKEETEIAARVELGRD